VTREQLRSRGVWYEVAEKDRSQLYLDLLPAVELPEVPELLAGAVRAGAEAGTDPEALASRPGQERESVLRRVHGTGGALAMGMDQ
jgi:hypothetical protein